MAIQIAGTRGVSPMLLADRHAYADVKHHLPPGLAEIPVRFLPARERLMRIILQYTRLLPIERWSGDVDWIYCPREQPVATRNARLAVTVHDVAGFERDIAGLRRKWGPVSWARDRLTISRILARADLIATVSQYTKRRLLQLFSVDNESRIVVVGNGVSQVFFRKPELEDTKVLEKYNLLDRPYMVVVGELTPRKGGDRIIELAEKLKQSRMEPVIVVSGKGHDSHYLSIIEERKRQGECLPIRLCGYVPDNELAVLLSHCLALLFLSRYEGFGMPAVEAMAAGTPVVCSRAGSLPEIVGEAGILVSGTSVDEVLSAVSELSNSDRVRNEFVEAGRARARTFTWERCASRLLAAMSAV